ncbi:hypothetical protein MKW94_001586 [Papaver nudicaule]|uniref:Fe2OG dioxygenase domain-containing protein n=1 Tax=Papaver nudicaule TaxID=74823 RepID=A0AA41SAF3_PAPNU|nr:hypothetical protein [Papaver nudicaule]
MKELFSLPDETKEKNVHSKPHRKTGYLAKIEAVPLFESLGIINAHILDEAREFTYLMWPNGNPTVCQTIHSVAKMLQELEGVVRKMIFENLGVEDYYDSNMKNSDNIFRVLKYKAPRNGESNIGLPPHTDKSILTILYQYTNGLEFLSKEGQWFETQPGTFIVLAGEALMAWSNGRIHAPTHRVVINGEKDRYSYAIFATPNEGATVEIPKELIDKDHPLRFRSFDYMEFLRYLYANPHLDNPLKIYAGVEAV